MKKELAKAAVQWWVSKMGAPTFETGSDDVGSRMAAAAARLGPRPSAEALSVFASDLEHRVVAELESGGRVRLRVDYHPEGLLYTSASVAGIERFPWPWKTQMEISSDKIEVAEGYGQPWRVLGAAS